MELLLRVLSMSATIPDVAAQVAQAVVQDNVSRVQVPALLASANSWDATLVDVLLGLACGPAGMPILEHELQGLLDECSQIPQMAMGGPAPLSMHNAVAAFISRLQSHLYHGLLPSCVVALCRFLYVAAEVRFSVLAAQNAVVTLLVSCVITPRLLGVAQRPHGPYVKELTTLLQRVSHFAHYDDTGEDLRQNRLAAGPGDLEQVLQHVAAFRDLVWRVLEMDVDRSLGLVPSADDADNAARWLVQTSQHWVASGQEQLASAARPLANLTVPTASNGSHRFPAFASNSAAAAAGAAADGTLVLDTRNALLPAHGWHHGDGGVGGGP